MMLRKLNFKAIFCLFILVLPLTVSGLESWAEEQEVPAVPVEEKITIATWNIESFGYKYPEQDGEKKKEDRTPAELKIIAEILARYDFIVITEFMDADIRLSKEGIVEGLKEGAESSDFMTILKILNNYDHRVSPMAGLGFPTNEGYAFLFKKQKFKVVKGPQLYPDAKGKKGKFTRDPCWATFRAGNFDFTVIAVHLYFGPQRSEKERKESYERRRRELEDLAIVYNTVQGMDEFENDILLVGDFNLQPNDEAFEDIKISSTHEVEPLVLPPKTTNISKTQLYDNILLQPYYLGEYSKDSNVFYFDGMLKGTDIKPRRISNHVPVWAEFRINLDDDDGKKPDDDADDAESR